MPKLPKLRLTCLLIFFATTISVQSAADSYWNSPSEPDHDVTDGVSLMFPIPEPLPMTAPTDGGIAPDAGETPIEGGWIRVVDVLDPPHFDPVRLTAGDLAFTFSYVYERLFTFRYGPGYSAVDFTPVPALGLDFRQTAENTYLIPLRRGVTWQDKPPVNGREFVCSDAQFSLERYLTPEAALGSRLGPITEVECVNDYLLRITTATPFAPLMSALAMPTFPVLPPEILDEFGGYESAESVVSIGPFTLEKHEPGVKLVFKRNPNFWRKPLPFVEGIVVNFSWDEEASTARFLSKEVDFEGIYSGQWSAYGNGTKRKSLANRPKVQENNAFYSMMQNYLSMPTQVPPFDDVRVRQAISMAIDRQAIGDIAFAEDAIETNGVVSAANSKWYLPRDQLGDGAKYFEYDPEGAKALLAEAGYPNGFKTRLAFASVWSVAHAKVVDMLVQMLGEVGIEAETSLHGFVEYAGLRDTGIPDGLVLVDRGAANDPDHVLSFYLPGDPLNASQVDDPELTEMILAQRGELDEAKRRILVHDAQQYVAEEVYYVPINSPLVSSIFHDYVRNYSNKEGYDRTPLALIWLSQDAPGRSFEP